MTSELMPMNFSRLFSLGAAQRQMLVTPLSQPPPDDELPQLLPPQHVRAGVLGPSLD